MNVLEAESLVAGPFGKFNLRHKLGSGGMAEVWLADMAGPMGFNMVVALKCLHPALTASDELVDSFVSEARLGGNLNHPNIVQTLDLGHVGGQYFLAMQYVEGVTLAQLLDHHILSRKMLPLAVTLEIVNQICMGLAFAHDAKDAQGRPLKMIHRDLKPPNILLSLHGDVKISDFGVAKATSNLRQTTKLRTIKGTLAYMSPEQASCEELDHRSDLFSLGVILFGMLTLRPLFPNVDEVDDLLAVIKVDIKDRLVLLEGLPPALVKVVLRLLEREKEARFASAAEVRQELVAIAEQLPPSRETLSDLVREVLTAVESGNVRPRAIPETELILEPATASIALGRADDSSGVSPAPPQNSGAQPADPLSQASSDFSGSNVTSPSINVRVWLGDGIEDAPTERVHVPAQRAPVNLVGHEGSGADQPGGTAASPESSKDFDMETRDYPYAPPSRAVNPLTDTLQMERPGMHAKGKIEGERAESAAGRLWLWGAAIVIVMGVAWMVIRGL